MPAAPARLRKSRRLADLLRAILCSFISLSGNKKGVQLRGPPHERPCSAATAVGRSLLGCYAIDVPVPPRSLLLKSKQQLQSAALWDLTQGCRPQRGCGAARLLFAL